MTQDDRTSSRLAVLTGFLVIATFTAGKAARDATLLGNFSIKLLPTFVGIGAVVTIPLVLGVGRRLATKGPAWLIPRMNLGSAILLLLEWLALPHWRTPAAAMIYVHLAALAPVLVSGFWSTVNERLDPRAAKRAIASVGLGATLGGIAGGLIAQLVAYLGDTSMMLGVVAALQLCCAGLLYGLGRRAVHVASDPDPSIWTGVRVISRSSLLRNVAGLVVLGAIGAAALDFVFKADVARMGTPLRALAVYYTVTSILTALVQYVATDKVIGRLGVAGSSVALPLTVTGFATTLFFAPSAAIASIARGAELVVRSSIFRAGYELLFAPLPPHDKRPAKVVLDVGAERMGDIIGSQLISLLLFGLPHARSAIALVGICAGVLAVAIALHLPRAYTKALEASLLSAPPRATPIQFTQPLDELIDPRPTTPTALATMRDPLAMVVEELRSGDRARVEAALEAPLVPELVAHVLPLIGWQPVSELATGRLRAIAPRVTGLLVDALLDSETDFTVRRRIPAILEDGLVPIARVGLWRALSDERFEVRYRAGKALLRMKEAGKQLAIATEDVYEAVLREVSVERGIWKARRLLDGYQGPESEMRLYRALEERSATALDHVFTLLGLVHPTQPLRIALAALSTDDLALHGTALEYLESVLPPRVRTPLWPFLELGPAGLPSAQAPRDLVRGIAHPSLVDIPDDN